MRETKHTGGSVTFSYSQEDLERQRNKEDDVRKSFREALIEHKLTRAHEQKRQSVQLLIACLLVALLLLLMWLL